MLELKSVSWQNFLSYGDYPTTVELDQLGQCLIVGEVIDDNQTYANNGQIHKSNGAGKSTIPNVIQWVLFGRTMHSRSPGNNVINWYSGKNCWGKVTFKNGDSIIRTRNTDGKNELLILKDGDETKFESDTLSTLSNQQKQLNRIFGLDWEIFCGSVFFNQYGKPWMEMADATRKKAIERVLHVDRFMFYAQAAKTKCDNLDKLVEKQQQSVELLRNNITHLESELNRLSLASQNFLSNKTARAQEAKTNADIILKQQADIKLPDIDKLKTQWGIVNKIKERVIQTQKELQVVNTKIWEVNQRLKDLSHKAQLWDQKLGKLCIACEQSVPADHVATKIAPIIDEKNSKQVELVDLEHKRNELCDKIKQVETILQERKPTMTVEDAISINNRWKQFGTEIARLKSNANKILNENNPHDRSITDIKERITKAKLEINNLETELSRSELLNHHYHYVYKAYNDRTKIKSFIFRDHIPFINSRLQHYLDIFDLDIKIELTESLGVTSNMWGYEFESGGERKRTDVAFMLAMFDFHEQMYGRQCNILVLDEVDGRLDDDGIDALINIIKTDLSHRVETILVISHRNLMFDTFPREMRVVRKNRLSTIETS